MRFHIVSKGSEIPDKGVDDVYLIIDRWNDYSFVTSFHIYAFDGYGRSIKVPDVRIGFVGQTPQVRTYESLPQSFSELPKNYFSLGTSASYYKSIVENFTETWRAEFLSSLRDVAWNDEILETAENENVFKTSHLRSIKISQIRDQFSSIIYGEVQLTDFNFGFVLPQSEKFAGFDLSFEVRANSTPTTNMHALIGRNGVGKTTLLKSMIKAIDSHGSNDAHFYQTDEWGGREIGSAFFSKFVSVAFSVFDPFEIPSSDDIRKYSYIGLTDYSGDDGAIIKSQNQIFDEFANGLAVCFENKRSKNRWIQAVETLQSDDNFADMKLLSLVDLDGDELREKALTLIKKMSSGHSIVIFTMTLLVSTLEERSLVLFDEPESHLHPPLLSALMRSLSQLLHTRNAVAIVATHSPVVLQEIPSSCVWKVFRSKLASETKRPDTETFGENVGTLTREAFGLEVERSGFHTILSELVDGMGTYEDILAELGDELGHEARGILKAMVVNRDEQESIS